MDKRIFNRLGWMCFSITLVIALCYGYAISHSQSVMDSVSILTNFFVAFATFTAACTGVLLYSNWKDEKHYDLKLGICLDIIEYLHKLEKTLDKPSRLHYFFMKLPERIYVFNGKSNDFDVYETLLKLKQSIKLYSSITNNSQIFSDFRKLEAVALHVNSENSRFYQNIYPEYFDQFLVATNKNADEIEGVVEYLREIDISLEFRYAINAIKHFYKEKKKYDYSTNDKDHIISEQLTITEHYEIYKIQLSNFIEVFADDINLNTHYG